MFGCLLLQMFRNSDRQYHAQSHSIILIRENPTWFMTQVGFFHFGFRATSLLFEESSLASGKNICEIETRHTTIVNMPIPAEAVPSKSLAAHFCLTRSLVRSDGLQIGRAHV